MEKALPLKTQLSEGSKVIAVLGDSRYPGIISEVNDTDQGDFEYYVDHDNGSGSYWPEECLEIPGESPAARKERQEWDT